MDRSATDLEVKSKEARTLYRIAPVVSRFWIQIQLIEFIHGAFCSMRRRINVTQGSLCVVLIQLIFLTFVISMHINELVRTVDVWRSLAANSEMFGFHFFISLCLCFYIHLRDILPFFIFVFI